MHTLDTWLKTVVSYVQQTETIPTEHLVVLQKDLILQKLQRLQSYGKQPKYGEATC